MIDTTEAYRRNSLNAALGRGTIYTVLAVLLLAGLVVTLLLGFQGIVGPGLFNGQTAFAVGGLAIIVLSVAMLVLLFSLSGTIRLIQNQMAQLTALRDSIESSYARLRESTQALGTQVGTLREVLVAQRETSGGRKRE